MIRDIGDNLDNQSRIGDTTLCQEILHVHPLVCVGPRLFEDHGLLSQASVCPPHAATRRGGLRARTKGDGKSIVRARGKIPLG